MRAFYKEKVVTICLLKLPQQQKTYTYKLLNSLNLKPIITITIKTFNHPNLFLFCHKFYQSIILTPTKNQLH